ncbi:MAG TPA: hypothetical protein PK821_04440 [Victivallales bacterium]|nr:hypothetical protein [Victivallales bacterium]
MKIIEISFDDILFDKTAASDVLDNACKRGGWTVSSVCELSDSIAVILTKSGNGDARLVFAKFARSSDDDIIAEIGDRYNSGFDLIGTFFISDSPWALYRRASS